MDTNAMGALAMGLMQGRKESKQRAEEREMKKALFELEKMEKQYRLQEMKIKQTQLAAQQKMMEMFQPVIQAQMQQYLPQGGGGGVTPAGGPPAPSPGQGQPPQFSPSFGGGGGGGGAAQGGGVSDQAAMLQQMMGDPIIARFLQGSMTNQIDFPGMAGDLEARRHNSVIEGQGYGRLQNSMENTAIRRNEYGRGFSEGGYQEVYDPASGAMKRVWSPKYGTDRPKYGTDRPDYIAKPSAMQTPISPEDLSKYRNESGMAPSGRVTPQQAMESGFQPMGEGMVAQMMATKSAEDIVTAIEQAMESVFPKTESATGRLIGGAQRSMGAALQTNIEAAKLKKLTQGTLGPMIRALGEKGALSDGDVKRATALMPKLTDRADVAWDAVKEIKAIVGKAKTRAVGGETIGQARKLTVEDAKMFLQQAGGDKDAARQMARQAGYEF